MSHNHGYDGCKHMQRAKWCLNPIEPDFNPIISHNTANMNILNLIWEHNRLRKKKKSFNIQQSLLEQKRLESKKVVQKKPPQLAQPVKDESLPKLTATQIVFWRQHKAPVRRKRSAKNNQRVQLTPSQIEFWRRHEAPVQLNRSAKNDKHSMKFRRRNVLSPAAAKYLRDSVKTLKKKNECSLDISTRTKNQNKGSTISDHMMLSAKYSEKIVAKHAKKRISLKSPTRLAAENLDCHISDRTINTLSVCSTKDQEVIVPSSSRHAKLSMEFITKSATENTINFQSECSTKPQDEPGNSVSEHVKNARKSVEFYTRAAKETLGFHISDRTINTQSVCSTKDQEEIITSSSRHAKQTGISAEFPSRSDIENLSCHISDHTTINTKSVCSTKNQGEAPTSSFTRVEVARKSMEVCIKSPAENLDCHISDHKLNSQSVCSTKDQDEPETSVSEHVKNARKSVEFSTRAATENLEMEFCTKSPAENLDCYISDHNINSQSVCSTKDQDEPETSVSEHVKNARISVEFSTRAATENLEIEFCITSPAENLDCHISDHNINSQSVCSTKDQEEPETSVSEHVKNGKKSVEFSPIAATETLGLHISDHTFNTQSVCSTKDQEEIVMSSSRHTKHTGISAEFPSRSDIENLSCHISDHTTINTKSVCSTKNQGEAARSSFTRVEVAKKSMVFSTTSDHTSGNKLVCSPKSIENEFKNDTFIKEASEGDINRPAKSTDSNHDILGKDSYKQVKENYDGNIDQPASDISVNSNRISSIESCHFHDQVTAKINNNSVHSLNYGETNKWQFLEPMRQASNLKNQYAEHEAPPITNDSKYDLPLTIERSNSILLRPVTNKFEFSTPQIDCACGLQNPGMWKFPDPVKCCAVHSENLHDDDEILQRDEFITILQDNTAKKSNTVNRSPDSFVQQKSSSFHTESSNHQFSVPRSLDVQYETPVRNDLINEVLPKTDELNDPSLLDSNIDDINTCDSSNGSTM